MDGMLPNRHGYHWEKDREFIVCDDTEQIMIKIATIEWFGWWVTSVFSENTVIFSIQT